MSFAPSSLLSCNSRGDDTAGPGPKVIGPELEFIVTEAGRTGRGVAEILGPA